MEILQDRSLEEFLQKSHRKMTTKILWEPAGCLCKGKRRCYQSNYIIKITTAINSLMLD